MHQVKYELLQKMLLPCGLPPVKVEEEQEDKMEEDEEKEKDK
jgi:hypothetical protein